MFEWCVLTLGACQVDGTNDTKGTQSVEQELGHNLVSDESPGGSIRNNKSIQEMLKSTIQQMGMS